MRTPSVQNIGLSVCTNAEQFSSIVAKADEVAKAAIMVYRNHNNVGVGIKRKDAEDKTFVLCYLLKQEINLWKLCAYITNNESAREQIVEVKHLLKKWEYIYKHLKMLNLDNKREGRFTEGEEEYYWQLILANLHKQRISGLSHSVKLSRGSGGKAVKKANAKA